MVLLQELSRCKTGYRTKPLPYLGFGLRQEYIQPVLEQRPDVDWFEIISEGCLDDNGSILSALDEIAESYPVVMHGSPWPLAARGLLIWSTWGD